MSITFPTFSKLSQYQGQAPPPPRPSHQQSKVNKSSLISQIGAPSIPKNNNTPPVRHQREGCAEGTPLCVPFGFPHVKFSLQCIPSADITRLVSRGNNFFFMNKSSPFINYFIFYVNTLANCNFSENNTVFDNSAFFDHAATSDY